MALILLQVNYGIKKGRHLFTSFEPYCEYLLTMEITLKHEVIIKEEMLISISINRLFEPTYRMYESLTSI